MTDIEAIRARHEPGRKYRTERGLLDVCVCGVEWPCDTAVVLAALDLYREAGVTGPGTLLDGYQRLKHERDAARADADALSEALDHTITHAEHFECDFDWCVAARERLAAHDATKADR